MTSGAAETPARPDLSFVRLLRLDVLHAYFKDGAARDLKFVPLTPTEVFLKARGIQMRADGGSMALQAESGRLQDLWDERLLEGRPRCLEFLVLSADPLSQVYTAPSSGLTTFGPGTSASGALVPSIPPPVPLSGAAAATNTVLRTGMPGMPLALASLPLVPAAAESLPAWRVALGGVYSMNFAARGTLWKYLLLGDWSAYAPRLSDLAGRFSFGDPAPVTLENGSPALAIRSLQNIPLGEYSPQRFQLKDVSAQPGRVLIKRLPVAAPGRFYRESVDGNPAFISEIFIHR